MKKYILHTILIAFAFPCFAQTEKDPCNPEYSKSADKLFNKGESYLKSSKTGEAIEAFKEAVEIEPTHIGANYNLGKYYDRKGQSKTAKKYIRNVVTQCPAYNHYELYRMGEVYYALAIYDSSAYFMQQYVDKPDLVKTDALYEKANAIMEDAKFYHQMYSNPVPFDPKPVPGVCTNEDEYLAIITPDGDYAYFTRRGEVFKRGMLTPKWTERFVRSGRVTDGYQKGMDLEAPFNKGENEGGPALTIDNNDLFITICKPGLLKGQPVNDCDIYETHYSQGVWGELKNMGKGINATGYWDSQPSVSADGKTLYFASNREEDSFGGYDIFKSEKAEDGTWGAAKNIGPAINTAGNEKSPFIHTDSKTLYFASDGHKTLGGYDIFFAKGNEQGWQKPKNIGYPINTEKNDISFFVSTNGKLAYFASDRLENGKGGWDVYSFELYEAARPERVLFVKGDLRGDNGPPFDGAKVQLKNARTKEVMDVEVNKETGKYVAVVTNSKADDFMVSVKKKGAAFSSALLAANDPNLSEPAKIDLIVKDIKVGSNYQLNDIHFDLDSYELSDKSKFIIEEFSDYLKANSTMKVEIQGHTDSDGNDGSNMVLSKNRAESVFNYMISLGVSPQKLKYKGYGETKPRESNSSEWGKSKNRRTEFVILAK